MPTFSPNLDLQMHYEIDDHTDPWSSCETVMLMHGNAESLEAWRTWIPTLSRTYRVLRADMRGFGKSTAMPRDYKWSVERIMQDFYDLLEHLQIKKVHLVGAKVGGTLAFQFAAMYPHKVATLTTIGAPVSGSASLGERIPSWLEHIEKHSVESWARWTMPGRMGEDFSPAASEYWAKLMGKTAASTQLSFIETVPSVDVTAVLSTIQCPTLVITSENSNLGNAQEVEAWRKLIPSSKLLLLKGSSYHPAASDADICSNATLKFIQDHPIVI